MVAAYRTRCVLKTDVIVWQVYSKKRVLFIAWIHALAIGQRWPIEQREVPITAPIQDVPDRTRHGQAQIRPCVGFLIQIGAVDFAGGFALFNGRSPATVIDA